MFKIIAKIIKRKYRSTEWFTFNNEFTLGISFHESGMNEYSVSFLNRSISFYE